MFRPPYLNLPFYNNLFKTPYSSSIPAKKNIKSNYSPNSFYPNMTENINNIYIGEQKNKSNKNTNDYLFDLFGLKLYSDDILLISLIYFLYSEGVKDDYLFFVLILLLLS